MTAANFSKCLTFVLQEEGGYVHDPRDNGGATNKGVTQAVYDDWRSHHGLKSQSVRLIVDPEVAAIYRQNYWNAVKGDDLPPGVDYAVFDFAVNSGCNRAARYLQACVGVAQDGRIGPMTLSAIHSGVDVVHALCERRRIFLTQLGDFDHFGKGWLARVGRVEKHAGEMAG